MRTPFWLESGKRKDHYEDNILMDFMESGLGYGLETCSGLETMAF